MSAPFPPASAEDCLHYVRHLLSDKQAEITCVMIEAFATEAHHKGFTAGVTDLHNRLQQHLQEKGRREADEHP